MVDDIDVVLHAFVFGQYLRRVAQRLYREVLLILRVIVATQIEPLFALELLVWHPIRTGPQLVIQWTEELLDECVRELAVQVVRTLLPAAIFLHVRAALEIVEIEVRRPSEVLLSMRVVAFGPFVFLVNVRTKACLI